MKKTNTNLVACAMVFAMALVISNVMATKTIQTGIPLFGSTILIPAAVICYPITFLMTDIIGEIWGKKEARDVVIFGFVCQLLSTIVIYLGQLFPAADPAVQSSYVTMLGANGVFFAASMIAYLCSQSWDVFVFHRIRNSVLAKNPDGFGRRWIWNNGSTMTSQIIDTALFITIAFGIGFGWLFDPAMWGQLAAMIVGQYLVKLCLAALDTPFFYFFTRRQHAQAAEASNA